VRHDLRIFVPPQKAIRKIEDARRLPSGSTLSSDICVMGAGAAGITIALELANTATEVIVIVGGGPRERPEDRDLYRGEHADNGHEPLEENRRRGWGGTTAMWGGRCLPLDPIDFERRPYVPYSGWPVSYEDLLRHYEVANRLCEAGRFSYDAADTLPDEPPEMILGLDSSELVSTRLERWSPPTNFARHYGRQLREASNIRVLMHAHALHLQMAPEGRAMSSVTAGCSTGARFTVVANDYALACGGLENARLLLASRDVMSKGIGNQSGNVGRFYMSHVTDIVAPIQLRDTQHRFASGFERDKDGVYVRRRLWLTPSAQKHAEVGNAAAVQHRPDVANPAHRNALFSSTYLAKTYAGAFRGRDIQQAKRSLRIGRAQRKEHWQVIRQDLPHLVPQALDLARRRWLSQRRLPIVLGKQLGDHVDLLFSTEHSPNPESRVILSPLRDAFGMPRLSAHIAFSQLDVETVVTFYELIAQRLAASRAGHLDYDEPTLRATIAEQLSHFNSFAHHLGTTRMAAAPSEGVVDQNGRVFGVENLFVTGGSVFATSGHANPTLTIVALSHRLAEHLRSRSPK
jgi:choline dehydrogenase-like flavoprotein